MREIKFRAWDTVLSKFFDGDILNDYNLGDFLNDDRYIVTQYTGLKDINGVEIYDGDITKGLNRLWEVVVVENVHYWNGCYMFGNYNAHEFLNKHQHIEVIGNIYGNKELLEEK